MTDPSNESARRKKPSPWVRYGLVPLIAIFFLGVVLKHVKFAAVRARLHTTDWRLMAFGLVVFYAVYVFRGLRLWVITRPQPPVGRCTALAVVYQMLVNYLPGGVGNVTLPAILSRYGGVRTSAGTKVLIALKLLDAAVICGLACVAGLTATHLGQVFRTVSLFAGVCSAIGVAGLLWPHRLGPAGIAVWRWLSRGKRSRLGDWLEDTLTVGDAGAFRRRLPALFGISFAFGLGRVVANYSTLNALGVHLTIWQAGYQWSFSTLAGALPFQPPAGLGLSDAIRMALLYTVGEAMTSAAEVVVIMRAIVAPLDAVAALTCWAYLARRKRGTAAAPEEAGEEVLDPGE